MVFRGGFGQSFARRSEALAPETKHESLQLYVFPLDDTVLFPHTSLPLNVFEPRYLQMLEDSIANQIPIAISPFDPTDPESQARDLIVGYGNPEVVQSREDGSKLVFLNGIGRARLGAILDTSPYLIARAIPVEDDPRLGEDGEAALQRLKALLLHWIEKNLDDTEQRDYFKRSTGEPAKIVDALCMLLLQDFDMQQMMLETTTLEQRIRTLSMLLQSDGSILAQSESQLN